MNHICFSISSTRGTQWWSPFFHLRKLVSRLGSRLSRLWLVQHPKSHFLHPSTKYVFRSSWWQKYEGNANYALWTILRVNIPTVRNAFLWDLQTTYHHPLAPHQRFFGTYGNHMHVTPSMIHVLTKRMIGRTKHGERSSTFLYVSLKSCNKLGRTRCLV